MGKKKIAPVPEKFVSSVEYRLYGLDKTFTGGPSTVQQYEFKVSALVRLRTDITACQMVKDSKNSNFGKMNFLFLPEGSCGTVIAINKRVPALMLDKKTSFQPQSEALIMFSEGDLVIDMQNVDILVEVLQPG